MKRLTEQDRQEIIDSLQAELNKFKAEFIGVAPDWEPLHKLLPSDQWDGWMFMEHNGDLRSYKHGITRNYLHLDADARCYFYRGKRKGWVEIDPAVAVDAAYYGIEKLGETRESKYERRLPSTQIRRPCGPRVRRDQVKVGKVPVYKS